MQYFEEMKVGARRELGTFTFTPEDIKAFAKKFDPQPFHLDEEAGRKSAFGGLAASGWHVAAVWMKLAIADVMQESKARAARGEPVVLGGPSPGFEDMKWLKPVLAGDTLSYATEVSALRPSGSRPQWGLAEFHNTGVNQRGELVFSFTGKAFMPRRPVSDS